MSESLDLPDAAAAKIEQAEHSAFKLLQSRTKLKADSEQVIDALRNPNPFKLVAGGLRLIRDSAVYAVNNADFIGAHTAAQDHGPYYRYEDFGDSTLKVARAMVDARGQ